MVFCLMMLGTHPEIQERVYEEAMMLHEDLDGRPMDLDDVKKFDYLERVLKETLRIFPIGPLIGRHAAEDVKIGKILEKFIRLDFF